MFLIFLNVFDIYVLMVSVLLDVNLPTYLLHMSEYFPLFDWILEIGDWYTVIFCKSVALVDAHLYGTSDRINELELTY